LINKIHKSSIFHPKSLIIQLSLSKCDAPAFCGHVLAARDIIIVSSITGSTETNITLTIMPDDIPELSEEMILTLTAVQPTGTQRLKTGYTARKVIINQNDNPGGVFQFDAGEQLSYTLTVSKVM